MMSRGAILIPALFMLLGPRPAQAQRVQPWHASLRPRIATEARVRPPAIPFLAVRTARTRWLEGAIIGGTIVGALGAITGVGLCHFDDPCPHPVPFAIAG